MTSLTHILVLLADEVNLVAIWVQGSVPLAVVEAHQGLVERVSTVAVTPGVAAPALQRRPCRTKSDIILF